MIIPADIPIRAKRLADGDLHIEDVRKLFKWARSVLKPGDPVRDIGDFDAHPEQRTKGLTWELGRSFCALLRMGALGHYPEINITAEELKISILSCTTIARQGNDLRNSGFTDEGIVLAIKRIADKVSEFDGTEVKFSQKLTIEEERLYQYIRSRRSIPLAFTAFSITNGLFEVLSRHGVLEEARRNDFYKATCFINLFVVSVMHLSIIDLKGLPGQARLEAQTSSTHFGKIVIFIVYTIPEVERRLGTVRIYASDCDARTWVAPSLLSTVEGPMELMRDWNIPLEIGLDMKLHPLGGIKIGNGAIRPMPGITVY